ncbi:MAG: aminoacyl-tRNA hydrolase [Oscillospiraceae bacterium]|jgi:PTH1 family peptidyl-tRNA hydrolase|nr:aminoacyl-tRNA hydrolase [Oscillospiraceae bacterium]
MELFHKSGPPAWLVVGLGNPGREYEFTRHNAGFLCVDLLAERCGAKLNKLKFHALLGSAVLGGQPCLLLKPQTWMNDSGLSVAEAARFYQIPPERVLVIFDDISLSCGRLRIRRQGSDGGHNGVKSVTARLGSAGFPRIKLGVGDRSHPDFDLRDWVLSAMGKDELLALRKACDQGCEAAEMILQGKIDSAMAAFNGAGPEK